MSIQKVEYAKALREIKKICDKAGLHHSEKLSQDYTTYTDKYGEVVRVPLLRHFRMEIWG